MKVERALHVYSLFLARHLSNFGSYRESVKMCSVVIPGVLCYFTNSSDKLQNHGNVGPGFNIRIHTNGAKIVRRGNLKCVISQQPKYVFQFFFTSLSRNKRFYIEMQLWMFPN